MRLRIGQRDVELLGLRVERSVGHCLIDKVHLVVAVLVIEGLHWV